MKVLLDGAMGMREARSKPGKFHFHDRADTGAFGEAWVGAVLARAGLFTVHYPFNIDGKDHSESWDIEVYSAHPCDGRGMCRCVEVKFRSVEFTCPEDYPYEAVNVCSFSNFQAKWPGTDKLGRDFLIVSQKTGAVLWLPEGSRIEVTEAFDGERNQVFKAVQCPDTALRPLQSFVDKFG